MTGTFLEAYEYARKFEGGYSNHSKDPGGETWKGIARKKHPSWEGWPSIDKAKADGYRGKGLEPVLSENVFLQDQVLTFYRRMFWEPIWGDTIAVASQRMANDMFDMSINLGIGRASEFMQRSLNLLNSNGQSWGEIAVDGDIGPETMKAFQSCVNDKRTGARQLYKQLNLFQGSWYQHLMETNPSRFETFIGWFARVDFIQ